MNHSLLILLDIDGTLLRTGGLGLLSMRLALQDIFGTMGGKPDYRPGGINHRQIVKDLLEGTGITDDVVDARWIEYQNAATQHLKQQAEINPDRIYALSGGKKLVSVLSAISTMIVGVLTGNPENVAKIKLLAAGYAWADFRVGSFGDESPDRCAQFQLARQRAKALTGKDYPGRRTVIIGDTVHDIRSARAAEAGSIIVASGDDPMEYLASENPDALFRDLKDTNAVLDAIKKVGK